MLDKTIPWHSFIMSLHPDDFKCKLTLKRGYSIRPYSSHKDAVAWARIETAVGEFESEEAALECHQHYLEFPDELARRQWFVVDSNDEAVATCTVWWTGDDQTPCIHALSCMPDKQGMGLGKAVATYAINEYLREDARVIWLETQTWSWKAIKLYLSLGFIPRKLATFNETPNDYEDAFPLIADKLGARVAAEMESVVEA